MRHPFPWSVSEFPLIVLDASGRHVCEAADEETAAEIVKVASLAYATLKEIRAQDERQGAAKL
jgi:hypothetical protein